jgi:hypothetical protein
VQRPGKGERPDRNEVGCANLTAPEGPQDALATLAGGHDSRLQLVRGSTGCNNGRMRNGREKSKQPDTPRERQQIACDHQKQEAGIPRVLRRGMALQHVARLVRCVRVGSIRKG